MSEKKTSKVAMSRCWQPKKVVEEDGQVVPLPPGRAGLILHHKAHLEEESPGVRVLEKPIK